MAVRWEATGEWVFEAELKPLLWGRNVYTVLLAPDELVRAAAAEGTRRVEGTIEGVPVNLGLNRADVIADSFVYAGKALQRRLGLDVGDLAHCRLRPADPDHVLVPGDVLDALETAGRTAAFDRLRPAERRRLLAQVEAAAGAATRSRRIAELVRRVVPS